jgi:hypothetical protein
LILPHTVLDPLDIVTLQLVCKRLFTLSRDDALWREQCFLKSGFLERVRRRRELLVGGPTEEAPFRNLARALANGKLLEGSRLAKPREGVHNNFRLSTEKVRIRANWDPVYPGEKVNWYNEYIARHAPISTSWLQQPRNRESTEHEFLEVRGVALYTPPGEPDSTLAVAPLDDGSLCLWDISGTRCRRGAIWQRSKSGLLSLDPQPPTNPHQRSKMVCTGVTECISVDSGRKRAYIAIQNGI